MMMKYGQILVVAALLVFLTIGWAAGGAKEQKITITMREFSFTPAKITLQAGVPAEIVLVNKGKVNHEVMVYDTPKGKVSDWDDYAEESTYFKDMGEVEGEFPGVGSVAGTSIFEVQVRPGKSAELKFMPKRTGTFEIGCHYEGHYEAGMKGVLTVK